MFKGRFSKDGKGLIFSDFFRSKMLEYMRKNPGQPFEISPILAESTKQRGWFEAALCPLVAFYQEGMDHRNYKDIKKVREWLKIEFNSEMVNILGRVNKVAKSTKNELNNGFLERVVGYLQENFSPPIEALDPKCYKHWHDSIFPYGGPDNYIEYLLKTNKLKPVEKVEQKEHAFDGTESPNYNLIED